MAEKNKETLAHVLWIGGASDSGKSTVAQKLAERQDFQVYDYDRFDRRHHEMLAEKDQAYRNWMAATLDERWVDPTPQELQQRALKSFHDRFPLVIDDLLSMPANRPIVAEGFGFLPLLVSPHLSSSYQAFWLIPTETFKWHSMVRRGKPSFAARVRDPERARKNLFARDMLLAGQYRMETAQLGYKLLEVDGTSSLDDVTNCVEAHFSKYSGIV